jgi:hypothetical protein
MEESMRFELVIEVKTAQALGIPVPSWLPQRADEALS